MTEAVRDSRVVSEVSCARPKKPEDFLAGEDGQVHVLVAEDDETLRDLLASLLEREGYSVSVAAGGKEAMEIVTNRSVDVALLDIKMPEVSGIEVLKRAKEIDPHMEAVIITGYADKEMALEAARNNAYDFIRKPFADISQIPGSIRRAAEKRRIVLENVLLRERISRQSWLLQEKLAELRMLHELSGCIEYALDRDKLSRHLLDVLLSVVNAEACSCLLKQESPPMLIVKSTRAMSSEALARTREVVAGDVRELGDCDLDPGAIDLRYVHPPDAPGAERPEPAGEIRAHESAALRGDGEVVGIVSMFRFEEGEFVPGDVRLLALLAVHASGIVEAVGKVACSDGSRATNAT